MSITSGEYSREEPDRGPKGPKQVAQDLSDACDVIGEHKVDENHDRTKAPVSRAVNNFPTREALHLLPDFLDTWERLENALSPTTPFASTRPRLVLAACLVLPLAASCSIGSYAMNKLLGLGIGLWFFGKPVIVSTASFLDQQYPVCRDYMKLRNSILRGAPTNVQLAAAMLRVGEKHNAPLPPPPKVTEPPEVRTSLEAHDLVHLGMLGRPLNLNTMILTRIAGASTEEIHTAISPVSSNDYAAQEQTEPDETRDEDRRSTTKRIADRIKKTTKSGVRTVHKIAELRDASTSSVHVHKGQDFGSFKAPECGDEPFRFPSRHGDMKGNTYITTTATTAALSWMGENENLGMAWTVAMADIREVKKASGLGWKRKAFVDWALDREVSEGLVVKTRTGAEFCLTAVSSRDEMFNRIVALGDQAWEVW